MLSDDMDHYHDNNSLTTPGGPDIMSEAPACFPPESSERGECFGEGIKTTTTSKEQRVKASATATSGEPEQEQHDYEETEEMKNPSK